MTTVESAGAAAGQQQQESKQQIAYNLLIELLAYQFAFPVQWIDTQKELFASTQDVQRVVEIGPATVLSTMAKKSTKKLIGEKDTAQSIEREFLSITNADDARKIYFEYDEEAPAEVKTESAPAQSAPAPAAAAPVPVAAAPAPAVAAAPLTAATSVDKELTSTDVVITLVAAKMKKAFDAISFSDSVQALSAGKSTLQNEIIGDMAAEFGDMPDGSESTPLETLGEKLAAGFSGKLGKSSKKLVERFLSSKMPGGFGQNEVSTYLASRWGLGSNSQLAVQCFSVTIEPASRLSDVGQAHEFLDQAAARYAKHVGITLPTPGSGGASGGAAGGAVMVDDAALKKLKSEQDDVLRKQLAILASHLGIDITPGTVLDGEADQIQQQLDKLYEELGEEFVSGVKGIFDPLKERRYSAWWNWVREDVTRLLKEDNAPLTPERLQSISNRWTADLETILRHHLEVDPNSRTAEALLRAKPQLQSGSGPVFRYTTPAMAPHVSVDEDGTINYSEQPRYNNDGLARTPATYYDVVSSTRRNGPCSSYVHFLRRNGSSWKFDRDLTNIYLDAILLGNTTGISYAGKTALVTGAGVGSIGMEVVRGLLAGGARVIVTTSRGPSSSGPAMAAAYKEIGATGSELILLPCNAASKKDIVELVSFIYDTNKGLGMDIDFVVPFAAIPEQGIEIDEIDAKSEVAHRAMLTNVLRLIGYIKREKEKRAFAGRPTTVVLPLSPNHGDFGGDGLYSESKIGLESLFNRYHSEQWSSYISIIGAVIGWTRGTGLMSANNIVAEGIEKLGVMTFSAAEMAFNLLALLSSSIIRQSDMEPVYAEISGGLMGFENLKEEVMAIREGVTGKRRERQAVLAERSRHLEIVRDLKNTSIEQDKATPQKKRSNIRQPFPKMSSHHDMTADLQNLQGMVDMSRTAVVVGFSELGPWGSSRTRWQMESRGNFDHNGIVEMAWMMGLVKHQDVGWLDTETKKPVEEDDFPARYLEHILKHSGIRMAEAEGFYQEEYDPASKEFLQEVVLDDDLPPFNTSESMAQSFKLRHGEKVTTYPQPGDPENWTVIVKRGATFYVPKSNKGAEIIAGQLPKGWKASTYGIPEDIISQVDPVTLYALCCVCEAMYSAGIEDPYELYKHIHTSDLGNYIGAGAGPIKSARDMYRRRYLETPVQGDILQETFLNSMAAWTNMLLFGATGPLKSPSGTCATAVESLDIACADIRSHKVKVAVVGGVDDLQEEPSFEFANMKATMVAQKEIEKGFLPSEMSRPTAPTRAGFVESQGCGVQIVMSAELALKMGLPIYAVIAHTQLSGDGVGRSVPAPGQGVLTAARETPAASKSPLLDLQYRRTRIEQETAAIEGWKVPGVVPDPTHAQMMESISAARKADIQWLWNGGNLRQLDPSISPMRAALAIWGLTVDDIAVASFHGTSTKANDKNESSVINQQMTHLGRTEGNPLLVVAQKYLTGHPKGGAGAWMLNGCMQIVADGLVPGNRNAYDVDEALRAFPHLIYPSEAIRMPDIKAFMLTSFGFGQKGGIVIGTAPRLLFSALTRGEFEAYRKRVEDRKRLTNRAFQRALMSNTVFKAKDKSAWIEAGENPSTFFLDPTARV
ncbi:putative fatty acid synthase alpha subunit FasA [Xylariaceae sp. FL0255]|nr:putative fatty acid synthase alpha subunit FasA [Xylariaceae sp. FL0255]